MASFTAYGPSAMGLTPAIAPAAKFATATGGVTAERQAKYSMKRWTCISGRLNTPRNAGARSAAPMMYTAGVGIPMPSRIRNTAERSSVGTSNPPETALIISVNLPASALISIAPMTTPAAATAPTRGTSWLIVSVQHSTKRRGPIAVGRWNHESTITAAVAPAATYTGV